MGYKSAEFPIDVVARARRLYTRLRDEDHWQGYKHYLVLTREEMNELNEMIAAMSLTVGCVATSMFNGFTVIVEER